MKIRVLPDNISSKIAAGEVIQRPESAVKELMENSIDAGATHIELMVRNAGKSLIRVVDNGDGMSEEDALICIMKHATSKISEEKDLDAIKTLGFRGEALSSIVAVAQFEMKTGTDTSELSTILKIEDSRTILKEEGGYFKGTDISVKNLFYNIPARRNFLKSDSTELRHVIDTFQKLALGKPEIHFTLFSDDSKILDYLPGTLSDRIGQVFGEKSFNNIIHIEEKTEYLNLSGFLGKPALVKKARGDQYLFLNGRFVSSKQVNFAVFNAYENFLEKGDYPFFILFLEINPAKIDVNVHPSKLEVRFEEEKDIYNFVNAVVRKGLAEYDLVPSLSFSTNTLEGHNKLGFDNYSKATRSDFSDRPAVQSDSLNRDNRNQFGQMPSSSKRVGINDNDIDLIFGALSRNIERGPDDEDVSHPFDEQSGDNSQVQTQPYKSGQLDQDVYTPKIFERIPADDAETNSTPFIIQLHNKYILCQIKTGLMIIDQHVAHERILYEMAKKQLTQNFPLFQQLLFPKVVSTDPARVMLVKEIQDYLQRLGFIVKVISRTDLVVEAIPSQVKTGEEEKILLEILDQYIENREEKILDETENMAKSFSCKAAIKAGDRLSQEEMRRLIDELFATENPYVCPHGRPVVLKISLDEFDRRFGRTS